MMKKIIFIGLFLLLSLGGLVSRAQERSVTELRKLVAPGNKVAVVFKDLSGDIDEKDAYIQAYLKERSEWVVVDKVDKADFVLYVEGDAKWTDKSPTSKTYFMTPAIRTPKGKELWKGESVYDWANLSNGFRAVRGVSWLLVRSVILGLKKEIGEAPEVIYSV